MTQEFPLKQIDPATTTGIALAQSLERFSATVRTMMSGQTRPADLKTGLWLRTQDDGSAEVVYSDATNDIPIDIPIFKIESGEDQARLSNNVLLSSDRDDGVGLDLNSLTNVDGKTPVVGNSLVYANGEWTKKNPALGDAADVNVSDAVDGDILEFNGNNWVHQPHRLNTINDVNVSDAVDGDILKFNGTNWVHPPHRLNTINDVNVSGAVDGDVLEFNGTNWIKKTRVLSDVSDLDLSSVREGEVLTKVGSKWVARPAVPVGTVNAYAGDCTDPDQVPDGWLLCDGRALTPDEIRLFPKLVEILPPPIDAQAPLTLPNLCGEFIRGLDNGRGVDPDRERLSAQEDELKEHDHYTLANSSTGRWSDDHPYAAASHNHNSSWNYSFRASSHYPVYGKSTAVGGAESRPRNVALNYIIKHD